MKLKLTNSIILLALFICFISCHSIQNETSEKTNVEMIVGNKEESFDKFIESFYSDSLFQMSRIEFPLNGKHYRNEEGDFESEILSNWQKEDWKIIKNVFSNNDSLAVIDRDTYKRRFSKTDTLVIENVFIEDSGYNRLLKYAIKNRKWYLIYYEESSF